MNRLGNRRARKSQGAPRDRCGGRKRSELPPPLDNDHCDCDCLDLDGVRVHRLFSRMRRPRVRKRRKSVFHCRICSATPDLLHQQRRLSVSFARQDKHAPKLCMDHCWRSPLGRDEGDLSGGRHNLRAWQSSVGRELQFDEQSERCCDQVRGSQWPSVGVDDELRSVRAGHVCRQIVCWCVTEIGDRLHRRQLQRLSARRPGSVSRSVQEPHRYSTCTGQDRVVLR
jgi:hypothetical protein